MNSSIYSWKILYICIHSLFLKCPHLNYTRFLDLHHYASLSTWNPLLNNWSLNKSKRSKWKDYTLESMNCAVVQSPVHICTDKWLYTNQFQNNFQVSKCLRSQITWASAMCTLRMCLKEYLEDQCCQICNSSNSSCSHQHQWHSHFMQWCSYTCHTFSLWTIKTLYSWDLDWAAHAGSSATAICCPYLQQKNHSGNALKKDCLKKNHISLSAPLPLVGIHSSLSLENNIEKMLFTINATFCWFWGCLWMRRMVAMKDTNNTARRPILQGSKLAMKWIPYVVRTLKPQTKQADENREEVT